MALGKPDSYKCKQMKSENSLIHKKNSKRIKELNIMPYTIKLSKENIGRTLFDVTCSKIFFDPPPRVMKIIGT